MAQRHAIQYGTTQIEYEVSYNPRKHLSIEVHPDLRVTVKAPLGASPADIEAKLFKRAPWILKQQRQFEVYLPQLPPRKYLSGETHRYLGRQYRLKVMETDGTEGVKLTRGYFYISVRDKTNTERVKVLLTEWYRLQARRVFKERLDICFAKVGFLKLDYPAYDIRLMEKRWGSCTPAGKILLNLKLIQVPKEYIDYVIMHELCHLKEHNHSSRFYTLLDRVMPNWRELRRQLNQIEVA